VNLRKDHYRAGIFFKDVERGWRFSDVLLPFRRENTLPEKNGTAARLPRLRYGGSVARDATVEAKSRPAAPRPKEKVRCSPPPEEMQPDRPRIARLLVWV
jgi:hypothetical protein